MANELTKIDTLDDNLTRSLQAPALDPILLSVANDYLANKTIQEIADTYGVSPDRITQIIEKKEVKSYIDNVFLQQGYLNRIRIGSIISKVIETKLEEAAETGIMSKRDLIDWIRTAIDYSESFRPKKDAGPQVAVQVNNNLSKLVDEIK